VDPTNTKTIDDLLREAAPAVPYSEEHRQQLLLALRADALCHIHDRRCLRGYLVLTGLLLFLLLIGCPDGRPGSDSFDVHRHSTAPLDVFGSTAPLARPPRHGSYLDGRPGLSAVEFAESWVQHWRAGDYRLEGVTGWEADDGQGWLIGYSFDEGGSRETVWQMPFFPAGFATAPQKEPSYERIEQAEDQVRNGLAIYLGAGDRFVDGYPVRCERWLTRTREDELVLLQGHPLRP
jgi:hypothetical protein